MQTIIKKNLSFFIGFLIFLIVGLVFLLTTEKGSAILYFNDQRSPERDLFFLYTTRLGDSRQFFSPVKIYMFRKVGENAVCDYKIKIIIGKW